jgi:hypothetical protein
MSDSFSANELFLTFPALFATLIVRVPRQSKQRSVVLVSTYYYPSSLFVLKVTSIGCSYLGNWNTDNAICLLQRLAHIGIRHIGQEVIRHLTSSTPSRDWIQDPLHLPR